MSGFKKKSGHGGGDGGFTKKGTNSKGGGSGLSLERFMQGKQRPTKAISKKRKQNEKAVQLRKYRKLKGKFTEEQNVSTSNSLVNGIKSGHKSFYDKYFEELNKEEEEKTTDHDVDLNQADEEVSCDNQLEVHSKQHRKNSKTSNKPDPLLKAKIKAQKVRDEKQKKRKEIEDVKNKKEKVILNRKKQKKKLSQRTKSGQPVIKTRINSILEKLQNQ